MTATQTKVHAAIDALKRFDRREALRLLNAYFTESEPTGERWRSVGVLCDRIGAVNLTIEAARRYAETKPQTLDRLLHYCSELATRGRYETCLEVLDLLPAAVQDGAAIAHLRATLALQLGDFAGAEPLARKAVELAPLVGQHWLSLAMMRKFGPDDPDLAQMDALRRQIDATPPVSQATYFYALGKACHDVGDYDRAYEAYSAGAAIKRTLEAFDAAGLEKFSSDVVRDFSPATLAALRPSGCASDRAIFVTGLPRSGTTLVEQILTSHSAVIGGGELNLFRAALFPVRDFSLAGAHAYEARARAAADPWGDVARDYLDMLDERFRTRTGRIVDKTLNHSRFMGLILHALPTAKVVWLTRDPADAAISVFRNYFAAPIPWSYDFADIATYFRNDDMLRAHWLEVFPDRILIVPYEELVAAPAPWIRKILAHVGLPEEHGVFEPHKQAARVVTTASVAQVREPISQSQIGAARKYARHMAKFFDAYERRARPEP